MGDFFHLTADLLGPVDAVYDRAAFVALPEHMRDDYAVHLSAITSKAPQLLLSYHYDQSLVAGPPFSVSNDEVAERYADSYTLRRLASVDIPGGLKGKCEAVESVWLLRN